MKILVQTLLFASLHLPMLAQAAGGSPAEPPESNPPGDGGSTACTDYSVGQSQPSLDGPQQRDFRHFGNRWLSDWYSPYHMVHDEIVAEQEAVTVIGKFDYDWVLHKDLEDEDVHAYLYGSGMSDWEYLGEFRTNSDGKVYVPISGQEAGDYIVRMVVEGDLSAVQGYVSVRAAGHQAVLFDIDGTLTINDAEQIGDYLGIKNADAFYYAEEMVQAYRDKGYQLIFMTARPYWMSSGTRAWLRETMNQAEWHLRTNINGEIPSTATSEEHERYKREYIQHLQDQGIDIIRAYGNASSDIAAYADAGLDTAETYIIGDHAGESGTQAVYSDYAFHFGDVVENTPNAICQGQ